ncbi:hypothetical protein HBI11_217790 [Parastagonospora nodorum]|nr:hypothetical protein HBI11_217790 [Parastagonospora nodorum]KAH6427116.1 hypothetical protein HBI08_060870 [Parastagonospora nodorum]
MCEREYGTPQLVPGQPCPSGPGAQEASFLAGSLPHNEHQTVQLPGWHTALPHQSAHRLQAIENIDASCVVDAAKCCVPHGFYLVDLAHPGRSRKNQAFHSFLNDLERCNTLRIKLYNILPGNANATTHEANSAACQSAHYHPSAVCRNRRTSKLRHLSSVVLVGILPVSL